MKSTARRLTRVGVALTAALGLAATTATSALAYDWQTDDTDNISRSVQSGRAYTVDGSFTWQHSGTAYKDYRAAFATNLRVNGARGSCARLRVITHLADGSISKRFPAAGDTRFGYYSLCSSSGSAIQAYGGADVSSAGGLHQAPVIASADISICYAPNDSTPGTECYNFTVNRGD